MYYLDRADRFLARHFTALVPLCVVLGLIFPNFFEPLDRATVPLFAFMTFSSSLGGGWKELGAALRRPLPVVVIFFNLHVLMPLITLGLGNLIFPNAPLFTIGLVLEYAIPTAVASLMWADMSRGNLPLSLSVVLLDTLLSPVVVPLTMRVLLGSVIEVDSVGMMRDLLIMVAIPAAVAMTIFHCSRGRALYTWKPAFAPFSKASLLLIVIANATLCAPFIRNFDHTLVLVVVMALFLCMLGFVIGYWAGRLLRRDFPTILSMALNSGMRNVSAGAVLARQFFPADALFPVAVTPLFFQMITAFMVKGIRATRPGRLEQAAWEAAQAEKAAREDTPEEPPKT